jgi:hypothetical protein
MLEIMIQIIVVFAALYVSSEQAGAITPKITPYTGITNLESE